MHQAALYQSEQFLWIFIPLMIVFAFAVWFRWVR